MGSIARSKIKGLSVQQLLSERMSQSSFVVWAEHDERRAIRRTERERVTLALMDAELARRGLSFAEGSTGSEGFIITEPPIRPEVS